MQRSGTSVTRVLRDVGLPFALLEKPEIVIPLREQFRFLERAARETGDACFGARLGQEVRMKELSIFGAWVCSAESLAQAIERGHAGINAMLQTSTVLTLERRGPSMRWSIEFVEPETAGRHHNELLGVSYMIDTIRNYAGRRWRPEFVMIAQPSGSRRAGLEEVFATNISVGHSVTSIEFDATLLACRRVGNAGRAKVGGRLEPLIPEQEDTLAIIAAVTDLALYEGYPRIDWVAAKLGMSRRTLQRRLDQHGTTFQRLVEDSLFNRAKLMLESGAVSITQIALELGYGDLAHFTRAFRRWAGISPSAYRDSPLGLPATPG
ncbi:MAG: helix-turn-helix domain-containing protein [Hyphomicrobium sp.]|nr:helix-turn-helix domain-containing protein [Hyphomicrobium sp.]